MESSLSVVLPVRNSAATLARHVESLLDTLADLSRHIEVLVVDDASDDHTQEVADDLSRKFPQLRVLRHPYPQGHEAAVRTGLVSARGDVVFVQEGEGPVRSQELQQLWSLRDKNNLVIARASCDPQPLSPDLLSRLQTWGLLLKEAQPDSPSGLRMIRRSALPAAAILPLQTDSAPAGVTN